MGLGGFRGFVVEMVWLAVVRGGGEGGAVTALLL